MSSAPPFPSPHGRGLCAALLLAWVAIVLPLPAAADTFRWSVQYLMDNSRTVFGHPQSVTPRHCRGLAISPDGRSLYAGYIHSFDNRGEVRRLAVGAEDLDHAPLAVLHGPRGRAIATDDCGRVYIADEDSVLIYDSALSERQLELPAHACEGLTVAREPGGLALYTGNRHVGTVTRWHLSETGGRISAAEPEGFDGSGVLQVPGAADVRGLQLDTAGNLWIADGNGNRVLRGSPDGHVWLGVPVVEPCALAIDGDRVFVTRSVERGITVLDLEMNPVGMLAVPWEALELSPRGHESGALSGIAAWPGRGFYVANEAGKTAGQRSTYGATDERSDFVAGGLFRDAFGDDNEPILRAERVSEEP